jgi:hypothetical protein
MSDTYKTKKHCRKARELKAEGLNPKVILRNGIHLGNLRKQAAALKVAERQRQRRKNKRNQDMLDNTFCEKD